jgi:hypothetical protein
MQGDIDRGPVKRWAAPPAVPAGEPNHLWVGGNPAPSSSGETFAAFDHATEASAACTAKLARRSASTPQTWPARPAALPDYTDCLILC